MRGSNVCQAVIAGGVSFSLLVYEVCLSRFFAAILQYEYVFIAISVATLGTGLGAYLVHRAGLDARISRALPVGGLACSMAAAAAIMYLLPYQHLVVYGVLSLVPFIWGGAILASIMQGGQREAAYLYAADLLGAGAGVFAAVAFMNWWGPILTIGWVSFALLCLYVSVAIGRGERRRRRLAVMMVMLGVNAVFPVSQYAQFRAFQTSPNNVMSGQTNMTSLFTSWDAFSRTDVYDAGDELLYMTIDGGAVSPISRIPDGQTDDNYLSTTTASLAFRDVPSGPVLIIGAGGGQEVLTARKLGIQQIDAVDINEGSFRAASVLAAWDGDVFHLPGVTPVLADGRQFIRNSERRYALIFASLVKKNSASDAGPNLSENYIFTEQALGEYMSKLAPGGRTAFLLHNEKELSKMIFSAMKVLRNNGIAEPDMERHLAVIGTYQHMGHVVMGMDKTVITRPMLLVSKDRFHRDAAANLLLATKAIGQIPVHIPYVLNNYATLTSLLADQDVDVTANTDDRPFFYKTKAGTSKLLKWLLMLTLLAAACFSWRKLSMGEGIYFGGIGTGFMIIETVLVQKFTLWLGHPTLAFVTVLGTVLLAGGIGSCWAENRLFHNGRRYVPLLMIAGAVAAHLAAGPWLDGLFLGGASAVGRIFMGIVFLMPIGFFMGMPFAYGLSRIPRRRVAVAWALNSVMTVTGSTMAAILAFNYGFAITLLAGAVIYLVLFIIQPQLKIGVH